MKIFKVRGVVIPVFFIMVVCLWLAGCSPQKRLQRLIDSHPELLKTDTIKIIDTVIVSSLKIDTSLVILPGDTVTKVFYQDGARVEIRYRHDTLKLKVEKPADTVIQVKEIPVKQFVYVVPDWKNQLVKMAPWIASALIVSAALVMLIIVKLRKR
ncbi:MAG: hypothetical protein NTX61_08285 [Bacteroidetes bacterium]|nr:hypothetical protein [Bacteroidota bacterium]